jgi:hypothetical protein
MATSSAATCLVVITSAIYAAFATGGSAAADECDQIGSRSPRDIPSPVVPRAIRITLMAWSCIRALCRLPASSAVGLGPGTTWNLSMKAGLAPDAWKDGASFQVFQAEVFGEQE